MDGVTVKRNTASVFGEPDYDRLRPPLSSRIGFLALFGPLEGAFQILWD
jgi:hypothetical protein